jgi:ribose transport system ATP-binding protein
MKDGRIAGELPRGATEEQVLSTATGVVPDAGGNNTEREVAR